MANGTHDVFVELQHLPSLHAAARARDPKHVVPVTPEDSWDRTSTMEVQFYWVPRFEPYEMYGIQQKGWLEKFGVMEGADIVIAGPMYHNGTDRYEPGPYLEARQILMTYFKELAKSGKRIQRFFWIPTVPKPSEPWHKYAARNTRMMMFVQMLNEQSLKGSKWAPVQSYFADAFRMALHGMNKRADLFHFHCNKHGVFPERLSADTHGMSPSGDCRDPFNLNLINSILRVACDL
ncbi:hypothetical protein GPECTOR_3g124 [Gonium pectorale]|uniref:Uncharacterized protein n=1 Tax=Gonium pectorale TaxID=33097 RepID=A0A150GYG7_GONPE|nr:hypothetical protein GPECTOR_3g124 [Gonium pectorale]|eukprot:KXZ54956.1 hypothetical protein GPECTOR_3g124 [Gonium pectorale]